MTIWDTSIGQAAILQEVVSGNVGGLSKTAPRTVETIIIVY